jgi:serine/threonine-protein kinase
MPGEQDGFAAEMAGGLQDGAQIAGYRLEERIGQGGMAVIFRARDGRLGRVVALKILAPALAADDAFRRRFIRESQAAAAVDDPHIIPVFEAGEAGGVLFLAMRYVPGGDARTLVRREGALPPGRAAAIVSPVALALDSAHAAGLVHRDVKPSNMLMDVRPGRPDHVYLSDFGLSKAALAATGLTGTGQFLGTLEYTAPEQIQGRPVDGRADQYALACSAFELLTGGPPFQREEAAALMFAHLSEPPPALSTRRKDLPRRADAVLATAMAKDPAARYASCREFADALRTALGLGPYAPGFAAGSGPAATVPSPPAPPPATEQAPLAAPGSIPVTEQAAPPTAAAAGLAGRPRTGLPPGAPGAGVTSSRPAPRRRRTRAMLIGVAVLAVAGVTAGFLLAGSPGPPLAHVTIAARSSLAPVDGDVYVGYRAGREARATISGQVRGAQPGEVAGLYAQPFPYRRPPARLGSATLHPDRGTASYAFTGTPGLAPRYTVEVFPGGGAGTALARSPAVTVYVGLYAQTSAAAPCRRPVCRQTFQVRVFVPAAALASEIAKRWYPYLGLRLAPAKAPPAPAWQRLGSGAPQVSGSRQVSPTEFDFTVSFSFRIGNSAYAWNWSACAQDTEAENGLGLPGHHGCGDRRLPAAQAYTG